MNRIEDNIRLLSIFHYVFAGLVALIACIPLIHITMGVIFLVMPEKFCESGPDCAEQPAQIIGWIFLGVGTFALLIGWTFAVLVAMAGRFLARRVHLKYCIAVAAASCLFMPFGTVLGVFTLIVLTKKEAEALFAK
jgi:hypothetical protein